MLEETQEEYIFFISIEKYAITRTKHLCNKIKHYTVSLLDKMQKSKQAKLGIHLEG